MINRYVVSNKTFGGYYTYMRVNPLQRTPEKLSETKYNTWL